MTVSHPILNLNPETIRFIRKHSLPAEQTGHLLPEQLALIHKQGWFNLFVPEQYGGLNRSLPEAVQLEESLAWADGSLGWVVTLCSGAAMFVGFFNPELAAEVFGTPNVCLAGSGQNNGIAKLIGEEYVINGTWPYASGAVHATHFTANCVLEKDGQTLVQPDGSPVVQSFVFTKAEVELQPNWQYIGLNATAGHSFTVKNKTVPKHRSFIIHADHAQLGAPVYHYPFLQMAEVTLAANTSGMCLYFIDLFKELTKTEANNSRSEGVRKQGAILASAAEHDLQKLRETFYDALNGSWQIQASGGNVPAQELLAVSKASRNLAAGARLWVDRLYPYAGLTAARSGTAINQVWLNIHTASQHTLLLNV